MYFRESDAKLLHLILVCTVLAVGALVWSVLP